METLEAWFPRLQFSVSRGYCAVILVLHLALLLTLLSLGLDLPVMIILSLFLLLMMIFNLAKQGLLLLKRSVTGVSCSAAGWHLILKNKERLGPYQLTSSTRVDTHFVRLGLARAGVPRCHLLITPGMVGTEAFRRLRVFLIWNNPTSTPHSVQASAE